METYSINFRISDNNEWSKGFVLLQPDTGWMWLKDYMKKTLRKGFIDNITLNEIKSNGNWPSRYGGFSIKDVTIIDSNKTILQPSVIQNPSISPNNHSILDLSEINKPSKEGILKTIQVEKRLCDLMHPHQIEAAEFLIDRLMGYSIKDNSLIVNFDNNLMTGAILADDVGTGKSLVALSVIWSICRQKECKCILVCPTSLVSNWQNEVRKWLGDHHERSFIFVTGSSGSGIKGSDSLIHRFVTSHPTIHPVLIICYDMFRVFTEAFNTVQTLELLVCDEGHRIKNADGTKTSLALTNCCATRRLVITGTPIQNNLLELFAIVDFVIPGYLGSQSNYSNKFCIPISKGALSTSTQDERYQREEKLKQLRRLIEPILIRRTKEELLSTILPPRTEYTILSLLSQSQYDEYKEEGNQLICNIDNTLCSKKRMVENCSNSSERSLEVCNTYSLPSVLPILTRLRQICNSRLYFNHDLNQSPSPSLSSSFNLHSEDRFQELFNGSSKLKILNSLLQSIKEVGMKDDKVVIVSNFTSTLDLIQTMCHQQKWAHLRIDGSVTPDKRTKIVGRFNSPSSPSFVMLLSAKAGGVGLNLIGANRLILFEPDWNPATDSQSMGRVYREGQLKPVYIYRLITKGTIEEIIIQRQHDKDNLKILLAKSSHDDSMPDISQWEKENVLPYSDSITNTSILREPVISFSSSNLQELLGNVMSTERNDTSFNDIAVSDSFQIDPIIQHLNQDKLRCKIISSN